ncbi:39S ribosomal protein L50, mitochondrial isoform X2 [Vespa crabro]|uniref:39S ribosomal protein L50, mitochondrial isoform X2 n=1 Tax=Vespa crabro TaxID=7445 RepID=UPI001F01767F|nr:39S ribosomal protein L50, mitochondrial isoform X2 [Vespa crabro]
MKNMAALIRHASYRIPFKSTSALFAVTTTTNARRDVARFASKLSSANDALKQNPKLEATRKSLSAKGFLRSIKSYDPPSDVNERIDKICAGQQISTRDEAKLEGGLSRFKIFAACAEEFKHSVPNSLLCIIETVGDLKEFYHTPVDTATPLETLRRMQLPKNLHVQYEYHRFHPDTDTMFGGKTAFPLSSTLVTGLKYKKKYKGFKLEDPFYQEYKRIK